MNDSVTDVEVAEDYVIAGKVLYTVGQTLTATEARNLYVRHGVKVRFRCIPCKQPLRVDALGGRIRSPYFRKSVDNTSHLHRPHCRFAKDDQASESAATGGERPRPSIPTALVVPPGYLSAPRVTTVTGHRERTPQIGSQEVATTSYSVVDVCRLYLGVISKVSDKDPYELRKHLAIYPLTLPKGPPRTYADVFNNIDYFPKYHYSIYFGRIYQIFICSDGAAVTFVQKKNGRRPAVVLISQRQLDDPRWGRTLTTLLHGQMEPCLYVCGHAQWRGGLHVIELEHPSWAHFDAHPWWRTANGQRAFFDGTMAQLLATLSVPFEPHSSSETVASPLEPLIPEPEVRSTAPPTETPLQQDHERALLLPMGQPTVAQEGPSPSVKRTGLIQKLIRFFTRK